MDTTNDLIYYYIARGFVEPGDIVLDVNCGNGEGTFLLASVAGKVIGMDKDKEAITEAMSKKQENTYFIMGNVDQEPQLPECDVMVCVNVLDKIRYPESFMSKAKQATRKALIAVDDTLISIVDIKAEKMSNFRII